MDSEHHARLSLDLSAYAKLDVMQAGHLRHFHNLASQLDGQWHHMGAQESMQEFLDAYRYQLATMAYATGAAHYHRLPALRSTHKSLLRRLIYKMLRREVWAYWFNTSLSGNRTDPSRTEYRKPWADPVVRENIMYSGHLLLMTSLYAMLFDDDEFEREESLKFVWNPMFFGFGTETFSYDNRSLQGAILKEMERNKWVGVCCEPNLVFIVCNQFPIIAMRYNDVRDGTNLVDEVLEKYRAAWDEKGMVTADGLFVDWWTVEQDTTQTATDVGFTAWANAFINSWNPELARSLYDQQVLGFVTTIDGQTRLQPSATAREYRRLATERNAGNNDAQVLEMAREKTVPALVKARPPVTKPMFGYVIKWLSEMGKTEQLNGLLDYADKHLNPTWEKGGLFYPRNDVPVNDAGDWTHMDPFSGNAAIGYARLNVTDGQRIMYDNPWDPEHIAHQPWIDGLDLEQGIDCLRGVWDSSNTALILTLKTWDGKSVSVDPIARNLPVGTWGVYVDGALAKHNTVKDGGEITVSVSIERDEVDVVFKQLS